MNPTTTPPLMRLILNVSLILLSIQTTTSTRYPSLQLTTIYDATTTQSPPHTTSPRDILSNLNYPAQETTTATTTTEKEAQQTTTAVTNQQLIAMTTLTTKPSTNAMSSLIHPTRTTTEMESTASHQSTTVVKNQPLIALTTIPTKPLPNTLSSLIHPTKTTTSNITTKTTTEMESTALQQTTTAVKNQPLIAVTTITTDKLQYTLSSLKPTAKRIATTIKTADTTTIHSRRRDFGQLTSEDKSNQEELFLPNESLPKVSPDKGASITSDFTHSPHEDKTLVLENNQAYERDVQNGDKIAFDNETNIGSDVLNISFLERFDKSTPQAINETLKELRCLNLGQAKIRNTTKLDSGIDIQVMCNDLIQVLENETANSNRSNNTEPNEVAPGQNYAAISLVIVGFVVMLLNGLVLTVSRDSHIRKNIYLNLVLGLAFNDFVLGCATCIGGLRLLYRWIDGMEVCIAVTVLGSSCLLISLYQSLLISLHRFLVLSNNEYSEIFFKNKRKYFVCFTGWVLLLASVSTFVSPVSADNGLCYHAIVFAGRLYKVRLFFTVIIITFIIATLVFYFLAMYSLRARYLEMSSTFLKSLKTENNKDRSTNKKIIDSMKLVTILLVALFIFSGPFAYLNMVDIDHEKYKTLFFLAFAFAVLNSLINPIIYYFKISEFKKTLKKMFCNKQYEETTNGT